MKPIDFCNSEFKIVSWFLANLTLLRKYKIVSRSAQFYENIWITINPNDVKIILRYLGFLKGKNARLPSGYSPRLGLEDLRFTFGKQKATHIYKSLKQGDRTCLARGSEGKGKLFPALHLSLAFPLQQPATQQLVRNQ